MLQWYLFCYLQVDKLILIDASVYSEGTGILTMLPKSLAYAGVIMLTFLVLWGLGLISHEWEGMPTNWGIHIF